MDQCPECGRKIDIKSKDGKTPGFRSLFLPVLIILAGLVAVIDLGLRIADSFDEKSHSPPFVPLEMARIEPGEFMMNGPAWEFPNPSGEQYYQRLVTLTRPYLISRTKITQQQWESLMDDKTFRFGGCGEDCPAEQVAWHDAVRFCNKLSEMEGFSSCYLIAGDQVQWRSCTGYRLPTEAEWEYAARAGNAGPPEQPVFRMDDPSCQGPTGIGTHPVNCTEPNPWGVVGAFDNVFEWTWNWYERTPPTQPVTDPEGPDHGDYRSFRGRGWCPMSPDCLSAHRLKKKLHMKSADLGFRVVRLALTENEK